VDRSFLSIRNITVSQTITFDFAVAFGESRGDPYDRLGARSMMSFKQASLLILYRVIAEGVDGDTLVVDRCSVAREVAVWGSLQKVEFG